MITISVLDNIPALYTKDDLKCIACSQGLTFLTAKTF